MVLATAQYSANIASLHSKMNLQVWMDEWKDFYFSINPGARKAEKGDLSK